MNQFNHNARTVLEATGVEAESLDEFKEFIRGRIIKRSKVSEVIEEVLMLLNDADHGDEAKLLLTILWVNGEALDYRTVLDSLTGHNCAQCEEAQCEARKEPYAAGGEA